VHAPARPVARGDAVGRARDVTRASTCDVSRPSIRSGRQKTAGEHVALGGGIGYRIGGRTEKRGPSAYGHRALDLAIVRH
jgi:hypothetical protein